jgi:hypothetical protein
LIEAPYRPSEYLDLFIRGLFAAGLLVCLHDGRDSVSDIALPILVFTLLMRPPAAGVHHRIDRVLRQFAGPHLLADQGGENESLDGLTGDVFQRVLADDQCHHRTNENRRLRV